MTDFDPRQYWEQRLSAKFSLAGVGHAGLTRTFNGWMYRVRRRVFARLLKRLPIELRSARVLDVGSGTGFYIERWREAGVSQIHGMDIAPTAITALSRRFPEVRFRLGSIGSPDAVRGLEGSLNAVSAMDVLFHIVDDEEFARALRNMWSTLEDGGWLIFSDNFLQGSERRLPHIAHRRLTDVRRALEDTGFEVVERLPMFVLMNQPVDTGSPLVTARWAAISRLASLGEVAGWLSGALLYPLELLLTRLKRESATTEIMACRKRAVGEQKAGPE